MNTSGGPGLAPGQGNIRRGQNQPTGNPLAPGSAQQMGVNPFNVGPTSNNPNIHIASSGPVVGHSLENVDHTDVNKFNLGPCCNTAIRITHDRPSVPVGRYLLQLYGPELEGAEPSQEPPAASNIRMGHSPANSTSTTNSSGSQNGNDVPIAGGLGVTGGAGGAPPATGKPPRTGRTVPPR
jgi:hypothetical protein